MPKQAKRKSGGRRDASVPYVKGFRPPTKKQQVQAIGTNMLNGRKRCPLPPEYEPDAKCFAAIPRCTSVDDWLAQYCEEGQSYTDFRWQCPWLSRRKVKYIKHTFNPQGSNIVEKYPNGVIYILPLGDLGSDSPDFDALVEYAQLFHCLPVKRLPAVKLETQGEKIYWVREEPEEGSSAKTTRILLQSRHKSGKCQLKIHSGLTQLRDYMPDDGICMIALTMHDLYEANADLFVAGMAAGSQRVAIFSLKRYDPNLTFSQEFWYKIKEVTTCGTEERSRLLLQRSCKLLVHELGHLLGLGHCIYFDCCMNGSGHLEEDFRQSMMLCPVDLRKLQALCGFDVIERYIKLKAFYEKCGFLTEATWVDKRLAVIQEKLGKD